MLVIGGYRDTAPDLAPAVLDTLADLRRADGVTGLRLTGLQPAELIELVTELTGGRVDDVVALADMLGEQTGGNAFLLGELCGTWWRPGRLASASGRWQLTQPPDLYSPDNVREVVGQRLARLTPAARDLLSISAVLGGGRISPCCGGVALRRRKPARRDRGGGRQRHAAREPGTAAGIPVRARTGPPRRLRQPAGAGAGPAPPPGGASPAGAARRVPGNGCRARRGIWPPRPRWETERWPRSSACVRPRWRMPGWRSTRLRSGCAPPWTSASRSVNAAGCCCSSARCCAVAGPGPMRSTPTGPRRGWPVTATTLRCCGRGDRVRGDLLAAGDQRRQRRRGAA